MEQGKVKTGPAVTRRVFIKAAGACALLLGFPRWAWTFFIDRLQTRTVERGDFRFDPETGTIKWASGEERIYRLTVDGLVGAPLSLSYSEIRALPRVKLTSDFHCVEGWSVKDLVWSGVRFDAFMRMAQPKPEAAYAIFHSLGETSFTPKGQKHYVECFPLKELMDPERNILLALDLNGVALTHDRGAPLRVVSPRDLGYKSIKFVRRIELVENQRPGWWTLANPRYPVNAPVPPERLRK